MATDVNLMTQTIGSSVSNLTRSWTDKFRAESVDPAVEKKEPVERTEKKVLDKGDISDMVEDLNTLVQQLRRELRFTVDEDTGELVIRVMDGQNDDVIRQIPPDEVLQLRKRLSEATGAIFRDAV